MTKFRNRASFGKRIEFWIIGEMIKEGMDVYVPVVDDKGIDAMIRKPNGQSLEIQIKASSDKVVFGDAGLFAAIKHDELRENYFFVFYSERMETKWIMSSEEFLEESSGNKTGKSIGERTIHFNGRNSKEKKEFTHPRFEKYVAENFDRFK